ncbi:response regulator [Larkinella knui]|uniref:histidine kinase n=1 Tax=Larkinella knui TaxID=2025310 RepID=A0A3P1CBR1_9BACT|nr:response regulator [Larkinella knui]RRB10516.1 response regulator [Larkinella knui]
MSTQILIIEDEVQIRENIAEWLGLNGFDVETAPDGIQGVTQAILKQPDLILCDIMMPGMDGHQVLEAVRGNRSLASVPFVFLTAKADMTDLRRGMALGADDYLTKPFTSQNLLLAIQARLQREALRKASLLAQLNEQHLRVAQTAGHEHNTPLGGIIGFTNLLIDHFDEFDREDTVSMLEMIRVCGLRLKRSLDNVRLMDILKCANPSHEVYLVFTTGQTTIDSETIEKQIQHVEKRQDQEINRRVDVATAQLRISDDNLRIILDELLDNAVKFSDKAGLVAVTGRQETDSYLLAISNEGRFFKPEDWTRIEPYSQFDRQQYEQQGFGLGLAIVKKLVELNNGSLEIESQPDSWTTVAVRLPLQPG